MRWQQINYLEFVLQHMDRVDTTPPSVESRRPSAGPVAFHNMVKKKKKNHCDQRCCLCWVRHHSCFHSFPRREEGVIPLKLHNTRFTVESKSSIFRGRVFTNLQKQHLYTKYFKVNICTLNSSFSKNVCLLLCTIY